MSTGDWRNIVVQLYSGILLSNQKSLGYPRPPLPLEIHQKDLCDSVYSCTQGQGLLQQHSEDTQLDNKGKRHRWNLEQSMCGLSYALSHGRVHRLGIVKMSVLLRLSWQVYFQNYVEMLIEDQNNQDKLEALNYLILRRTIKL